MALIHNPLGYTRNLLLVYTMRKDVMFLKLVFCSMWVAMLSVDGERIQHQGGCAHERTLSKLRKH